LARKMEIKRGDHSEKPLKTEKIKKWKLIQYGADDEVVENQEIEMKLKKKINRWIKTKNEVMAIDKKRARSRGLQSHDDHHQIQRETPSENAEPLREEQQNTADPNEVEAAGLIPEETTTENVPDAVAEEQREDPLEEETEPLGEEKEPPIEVVAANRLSTTITGDISVIPGDVGNAASSKQNAYRLTMDTFDCGHISSSKTICTQTSLSDVRLNAKYRSQRDLKEAKTISNWFVAPLLTASQSNALSKTAPPPPIASETENDTEISPETETEQKSPSQRPESAATAECEMQTAAEDDGFVPIPVIGPRTAGLSFIDPTIEINRNSLMLRFPNSKTHCFADPDSVDLEEPKERKQEDPEMECGGGTALTTITDPLTVNDIHSDIAQMDAQLANLSTLCNNIETQYYDINKKLDESQEMVRSANGHRPPQRTRNDQEQINTMEAWSLLQSIQSNLQSIDGEIHAMNREQTVVNGIDCREKIRIHHRNRSRKHQLKNIKAKTRRKRKKKMTAKSSTAVLERNLDQQTELLQSIFEGLK